mgnify:CR=1 FL=1
MGYKKIPRKRNRKRRLKEFSDKFEDTLISKTFEEKDKKENPLGEVPEQNSKLKPKRRKHRKGVRTYTFRGEEMTVHEIAKLLGLSPSFCYRKIREGYFDYLEDYTRDSKQIQVVDRDRKKALEEKVEREQKAKNFMDILQEETKENYWRYDEDFEDDEEE